MALTKPILVHQKADSPNHTRIPRVKRKFSPQTDRWSDFYHFTDRQNLDSIRRHGGLFSHADLVKRGITVTAPGGNQWSHDADRFRGLDGYVHLCFCNEHPMEYSARQDGRIKESIFLEIDPSVVQFDGVRFTPDVSNKAGVESAPLAQAIIDYEVLYTRTNWADPAIQQRRRQAKKYELLVPCCIPLSHIRNI